MAFWSVPQWLLVTSVALGGGLACRMAQRRPPDAGSVAACAADIAQGRLDSLGQRARRAGEQGDLAALHAVSDTLDSLERLAGPRCRTDTTGTGS